MLCAICLLILNFDVHFKNHIQTFSDINRITMYNNQTQIYKIVSTGYYEVFLAICYLIDVMETMPIINLITLH